MTTTVPNAATELGYLAEALADHYRRHDNPAGAALELATVLASVLTPADLNRVTDALDTVGLLAAAGAELAAAIAGERVACPADGITRQIHGVGVVLGVFSWLRRRNVTARTNQPERTFDAS